MSVSERHYFRDRSFLRGEREKKTEKGEREEGSGSLRLFELAEKTRRVCSGSHVASDIS